MTFFNGPFRTTNSHDNEIAEFESIGEQELRYRIAHGTFFGEQVLAEEWLRKQEVDRASALSESREAREREMLNIAKSARSDARSARITAIIAAVIAAASTIITAYIIASTNYS